MNNLRKYGHGPFKIAVVHGGPGASGEMSPVALEMFSEMGVLEPLQTSGSVAGQAVELKSILENYGQLPLILAGHSWGAWLSYIVAAEYPSLVQKLILISSGPFEESYADRIMPTRLNHLNDVDRQEAISLMSTMNTNGLDKTGFTRFGELMGKADSYDPLPCQSDISEINPDIFKQVWGEASQLRRSGQLLKYGENIQCPVVAIHGDYDSHPAEGVAKPLSRVIKDFRMVLINKCGHTPWLERQAKDSFYEVMRKEIRYLSKDSS